MYYENPVPGFVLGSSLQPGPYFDFWANIVPGYQHPATGALIQLIWDNIDELWDKGVNGELDHILYKDELGKPAINEVELSEYLSDGSAYITGILSDGDSLSFKILRCRVFLGLFKDTVDKATLIRPLNRILDFCGFRHDFTGEELSDAEHFYVTAAFSIIGVWILPVGAILSVTFSIGWEVIVDGPWLDIGIMTKDAFDKWIGSTLLLLVSEDGDGPERRKEYLAKLEAKGNFWFENSKKPKKLKEKIPRWLRHDLMGQLLVADCAGTLWGICLVIYSGSKINISSKKTFREYSFFNKLGIDMYANPFTYWRDWLLD